MIHKRSIGLAAAAMVVIAVSISYAKSSHVEPQLEQTARCTVVVPKQWGEYIGAGSYGLEFKDESGTVRFVKQFPCGVEGAPNVSLEVHRK